MTKTFLATALGLAALCSAPAAAQAPAPAAAGAGSQISIGTRHVSNFCLEGREGDGVIVINRCTIKPSQSLVYNENNGQVVQGDRCLAATAKEQPLVLTACANTPNQKWTIQNGDFRSDTGLCADITGANRDPGSVVIVWDCTGAGNQKFFRTRLHPTPAAVATPAPVAAAPAAATGQAAPQLAKITGLPVLASYHAQGKCMAAAGSNLRLAICAQTPDQSFHFVSGSTGQIVQGDKCLTAESRGSLTLDSCTSNRAQDWSFTPQGTLRSRSDLCVDIANADSKVGASIVSWDCSAGSNQKFYPAVAAKSGSFTLGPVMATTLRQNPRVNTVSVLPGYSAFNVTGSGGRPLSTDSDNKVKGGQNDTIIIGGAGVLTVQFRPGVAPPSVASGNASDILPRDWSFFSGATAGVITP